MMKYDRLTKREGNGAVTYDNGNGYYHTIYSGNDGNPVHALAWKLAELEDKIQQGTLVELPCKVGDTVYVIYQYSDFLGTEEEPFIEEDIAHFFVYDENKMKIVPSRYGERSEYWYKVLDILLTREEAGKRLKELQNG